MTTAADFKSILEAAEGSRLEFKEAKNRYDFDELLHYCVALANEGGGKIVLGVTDKRPRHVVGTQAFLEPGRQRQAYSSGFGSESLWKRSATRAPGLSSFMSHRACRDPPGNTMEPT